MLYAVLWSVYTFAVFVFVGPSIVGDHVRKKGLNISHTHLLHDIIVRIFCYLASRVSNPFVGQISLFLAVESISINSDTANFTKLNKFKKSLIFSG